MAVIFRSFSTTDADIVRPDEAVESLMLRGEEGW